MDLFCSTVNVTALMIGQQRALDGEDYIFSSGTVSMAENITTASVRISILPVSYGYSASLNSFNYCLLLVG